MSGIASTLWYNSGVHNGTNHSAYCRDPGIIGINGNCMTISCLAYDMYDYDD